MKKITLFLIALVLLAFSLNAQNGVLQNVTTINTVLKKHTPSYIPEKKVSVNSVTSILIDYDTADAYAWGIRGQRYIWDMNNHYTSADSAIKYCVVAFDSLYDYITDTGYPYNTVGPVTVDTIYALIGQENNSGTDDTLVAKIVSVDANGYPTTTVLWSEEIVIPATTPLSGANNDWLRSAVVYWAPGYVVAGKKFAVRLEYNGSKQDTAGFLASFHDRTAFCFGQANQEVADKTNFSKVKASSGGGSFYANSFFKYTHYTNQFPRSDGSPVYYECDNDNVYTAGVDGELYIQNILVFAQVSIAPLAVHETTSPLSALSSFPNPVNDAVSISYALSQSSNIVISFYDITGKEVYSINEGKKSVGNHTVKINTIDFSSGMYFYTVSSGKNKVTGKLIVE